MRVIEDWIHRLTLPLVMLTVMVTVWVVAWCKSVQADADRHYWPPINSPISYVDDAPKTQ